MGESEQLVKGPEGGGLVLVCVDFTFGSVMRWMLLGVLELEARSYRTD